MGSGMDVHLAVEELTKEFHLHVLNGKRVTAFAGVSFRLQWGEALGIRGPSGAGKSSLLKCLYRTYRPTAGRMHLWHETRLWPVHALPETQMLMLRRSAIGYVSQFLSVVPRISAVDVVAEPLLVDGVSPGEARRRAMTLLDRLRIPKELWECYPSTFSGGEKQRVNLARALVHPRPLLLLDEPTASLDPGNAKVILELLGDLRARGISMVGVFHNAADLAVFADRVLDMRGATGVEVEA